jgi:hypothetical protein
VIARTYLVCRHFAWILLLLAPLSRAGNFSDLWYNPSESGWGVNLIQQYDTIFATLFVYGADNRTRWYVAPALRQAATPANFSGDLFETNGPWFGGTFTQGAVSNRRVGTMIFTALVSGTAGTVSYSVDGVSVTKNIQRQTWSSTPGAGNYWVQVINIPVLGECSSGIDLEPYVDATVDDLGALRFYFTNTQNQRVLACQVTGTVTADGQLKKIAQGTVNCPGTGTGFVGIATIADWRIEGITYGVTTLNSGLFMTGTINVNGPGGCFKLFRFAGVRR